jgi:hypothetical protein
MGDERRQWLERLASACESLILEASNHPEDMSFEGMQADAAGLLARVRTELLEVGASEKALEVSEDEPVV